MNYYKALENKDRKFFYCEGFRKFVLGRVACSYIFFNLEYLVEENFEDEWIVFE